MTAATSPDRCAAHLAERRFFHLRGGVARQFRSVPARALVSAEMTETLLPDYAAVRHILTSPSIAARTASYIGADDFDWHGLLSEAEAMSMGEGVLLRVAYDLWEANGVVCVWELARLDGRAFERVVDALYICRGELEPGTKALHAA